MKSLWINFITHNKGRWQWKPSLIQSQEVSALNKKMWIAPHWEFCWGPFVFQWTGYSHKKEYKGTYFPEMDVTADIQQLRINELEHAIRTHRKRVGEKYATETDRKLWNVLNISPFSNYIPFI